MPGLDLEHLSSNWKKLQEKLHSQPKETTQKPSQNTGASNGQKRKRQSESSVAGKQHDQRKAPRRQQPTATSTNAVPLKKKRPRTMGLTPSHPTHHPDTSTANDTSPAPPPPLSPPPTLPTTLPHHPSIPDTPNSGLHPTNKPGKYLSLDCEMVGTGPPPHSDSLLARASVVNYHGQQIYDSYVLPPQNEKITDYRTFVSGIKPSHLRPGVARPFPEVQEQIADLLQGRVLVGHALRNDLRVLMLGHPARDIRDTSRYAGFRVESKGKPPALRVLVERELGWEGFQRGEHSSLEDARAAMGLWRKEKGGFEEEVRRRFGGRRERGKGKGMGGREVEDGESEDEVEGLEGEDGSGDGSGDEEEARPAGPKTTKKKRKKKKRTKR
ncbi:hypothetical protein MBLNU230_g2253t1 [Neophaeotheca triangularis]